MILIMRMIDLHNRYFHFQNIQLYSENIVKHFLRLDTWLVPPIGSLHLYGKGVYLDYGTALPKSGISRTMTTSVRDAPITSGGLGVPNLYKLMGTLRTALLVNQCWQKTPTWHLLHTCIEDMVLETGLYGLLWHQNFPAYSSWTSQYSWIYHVWV